MTAHLLVFAADRLHHEHGIGGPLGGAGAGLVHDLDTAEWKDVVKCARNKRERDERYMEKMRDRCG